MRGPPEAAGTVRYASAQGRWILLATILGSGVTVLDGTIVNVALPRIGAQLGASLESLQWIVNAYAVTLAGFLLLSGALADRLGRRRVFLIGVVWFALASTGCALAPNAASLIALRALQGVGGALLTPGSLAILQAAFVREDRSTAVGAWSGLGGLTAAIGPLLGGFLAQLGTWTWRLAFFLNLPLAAAVVFVTLRHVPETRDPAAPRRLDVPGATLAALGLAGVAYGLTEGPAHGFGVAALVALVGGVTALGGFLLVEGHSSAPLVPLSLFRSRQFSGANLVTLLVYAALGGAFFLLPLQLQQVLGLSPLAAGSTLLPVTGVMLLLSARMGRLAEQHGPRLPMTLGPLLAGAGFALMSRIGQGSSYLTVVLPAVLVFAMGLSMTVAPLTAAVLAAAPVERVGVASAINNDVARTAGLVAVALLPALGGSARNGDVTATLSIAFPRAMLCSAALCALGGLTSALVMRTLRANPEGEP